METEEKRKEESKEESKEKSIPVDCSFCGAGITCPPDQLKAGKHACYECFVKLVRENPRKELQNIHADIPSEKLGELFSKMIVDSLIMDEFPRIWKENKEEFKEMGKRELAQEMFTAGAELMAAGFVEMMEGIGKKNFFLDEETDEETGEDCIQEEYLAHFEEELGNAEDDLDNVQDEEPPAG